MSQHRKNSMSTVVVSADLADRSARGKHRAPGQASPVRKVAAGALLVGSVVLAAPAAASAVPLNVPQIPGLPAIALPPMEVPEWINDGLKQLQSAVAGMVPSAPAAFPTDGAVSSGFGPRWGGMHWGTDIAAPIGTPIRAVSSGTVVDAGPASGFGLWVRVRHDDGFTSTYGHVNDILSFVGQRVNAGQTIATVGNRGDSTGPHLHIEVAQPTGARMNPQDYLAAKGVWRW